MRESNKKKKSHIMLHVQKRESLELVRHTHKGAKVYEMQSLAIYILP